MHDITFPLRWRIVLLAPALAVFIAFWLLPMAVLVHVSANGHAIATYRALLTNARYMDSLVATVALSAAVTLATLVLSVISGLLLARREFVGKRTLVAVIGIEHAVDERRRPRQRHLDRLAGERAQKAVIGKRAMRSQ